MVRRERQRDRDRDRETERQRQRETGTYAQRKRHGVAYLVPAYGMMPSKVGLSPLNSDLSPRVLILDLNACSNPLNLKEDRKERRKERGRKKREGERGGRVKMHVM